MSTTPNFDLSPQSIVQPAADAVPVQVNLNSSTADGGDNLKGIELNRIIDSLFVATGNWPRIIGGEMYGLGAGNELQHLKNPEVCSPGSGFVSVLTGRMVQVPPPARLSSSNC